MTISEVNIKPEAKERRPIGQRAKTKDGQQKNVFMFLLVGGFKCNLLDSMSNLNANNVSNT